MANNFIFLLLFVATPLVAEVPPIAVPKHIDEFVFVQTSSTGARPVARKDKATVEDEAFETAHKLPPYITYALNEDDDAETTPKKQKREAAAPAPAPPGAIKLNPKVLLEKYKQDLQTSTAVPVITATTPKKKN